MLVIHTYTQTLVHKYKHAHPSVINNPSAESAVLSLPHLYLATLLATVNRDTSGIEAIKMMEKWNVTYDKDKNKLHYGCLNQYYENGKTTPIPCGFRILPSNEHKNKNVILPSEFAAYIVSVHKQITGDREQRKQQLQGAVEYCVGKPDQYGLYNARLLNLGGDTLESIHDTEDIPKGASIGDFVLEANIPNFKVFSAFSPMETKVETDCYGNVIVTFFDYMGQTIGSHQID